MEARPGAGFFFEKRCHAMTSEAELSLGWADEGVCPYATMGRRGVCPYAYVRICRDGWSRLQYGC
jgi:hypothetical protein